MTVRSLAVLLAFLLCGVSCAKNPQATEQLVTFTRPDLPDYVITSAWQIHAEQEIRRDYLVDKLKIEEKLALRIVRHVEQESGNYDLNPSRLLALIVVESGADPNVVSHKGAVGLMQILPDTGRYIAQNLGESWKGPKSLQAVETNISFGAWYYRYLLEKFHGDIQSALAAYNWGPGTISKRLRQGQGLPRVYPGKVKTVREELEEVLLHEHRTRFWGGFDSFVHRTRGCYDSGRTAPECGIDWVPIPDGESLLTSYRRGIFSVDPGIH